MNGDAAQRVELSDFELVERAVAGETAAFATLVRSYAPVMRVYARRILGCSSEVDDVVQDACITAWQQLHRLDDGARVKSWLMRITGRKAVDRLRALKPVVADSHELLAAPAHDTPQRMVEARSGIEALGVVLDQLPDRERECWVLREIGDYSYEEIASELSVSTSTVRGLLARARKEILVQMEHWR